jgi:hypothetical protein
LTLNPFVRIHGAGHDGEPDLTLNRSIADIRAKTEAHVGLWGLDEASWAADLETGIITFTNKRGWTITAPVQVIGTFNTKDSTWLWGWDHPSVSEPLAAHARLARDFGEKYALERYATRKIVATETEVWHFTALACYLAGAQGGYRGPAGTTLVLMTFGEVAIERG